MLALFAVGVVTGTILSFELGLLWPVWMQDFGNVFGLCSRRGAGVGRAGPGGPVRDARFRP
jgi:hypothetical protein